MNPSFLAEAILVAFVPSPLEILIILVVFSVVSILPTVGFWMICQKAGISPLLSLPALIPFLAPFVPLLISVVHWPVVDERRTVTAET